MSETIIQLQSQLMEANVTSDVILDTRTPPRVKEQQKEKESMEHSHAGIAVPIDEDSITLEEPTKKLNFYKIAKPTTNSGLSTWILLSGQTPPSTVQSTTKIEKTTERVNLTLITDMPHRIVKPIFKKRSTTTRKPVSTTTVASTTTLAPSVTTTEAEKTTKLNKIKASVLNNAKKNITTMVPVKTITTTEKSTTTTTKLIPITESTKNNNVTKNSTNIDQLDSNSLPLEAKDNEVELTTTAGDAKKTRRPTTKRKKNKNKRRRPAVEKTSNSTKVGHKEKPIGTQIYNYLSREVVPTIGVGLVGLMVTAGLASYFLYPFGAARRNYDIDRKDKEGSYHYTDEYGSGGIAEEEAIGKVIAGMQTTASAINYNNNNNNYRNYNSKSSYPNVRNMHQNPVDNYQVTPNTVYSNDNDYNSNQYQPDSYQNKDVIEQSKETGYMVDDRKFVVGNVPKEIYPEATPVTVPEHGPRSMRLRKRRQIEDDLENDVFSDTNFARLNASSEENSIANYSTSSTTPKMDVTHTYEQTTTMKAELAPHKSFVNLLKDLFHMKVSLGLQLLQNATETVARYLTRVQKRLDDHYRSSNKTYLYH